MGLTCWKVGSYVDILIFCCCLTNFHKPSNLKQHLYHLTFFSWSSALGLTKQKSSSSPIVSSSGVCIREKSTFLLLWAVGRFHFLLVVGLRSPLSWWLLARDHVVRSLGSMWWSTLCLSSKNSPSPLGSLSVPVNLSDSPPATSQRKLLFLRTLMIRSGPPW